MNKRLIIGTLSTVSLIIALNSCLLLVDPVQAGVTEGLDFWAVWPPTHDSLAEIVVLTSVLSGATITISSPAITPTQTGAATPSTPYICVLDQWSTGLMCSYDGGVKNNAIHIAGTASVTVIFRTHSGLGWTADEAYLVLPTCWLGSEYYSLTYSGTCSYYVIIATKDNTQVTYASALGLISTDTLNQDQTLTVSCPSGAPVKDVSGRHVFTDASTPIGLVAGSRLTTIPSTSYAADPLMEMLLPVELWGCNYYTAPLAPILPTGDIVRIQASEDDTEVFVNAVSVGTITRAGNYIELDRIDPLWIHSDKPVQVAQYAKSGDVAGVGDPFEMGIIPREQFSLHYRLYSPNWQLPSQGSYVTIIAPNIQTQAWLDSVPVPAGAWTTWSFGKYATIQVTEGAPHTVQADHHVGVYSYGYRQYGSYGYPAGSSCTLNTTLRVSSPGYTWLSPELIVPSYAGTAGWDGWFFRHSTDWFTFNFTGIDTAQIDNWVVVTFNLGVTNMVNGDYGLDGLVDVVINPGMTPTITYPDVLLDNVDPSNRVYAFGSGGSYLTYGQLFVPKDYIVGGQLLVKMNRHTDDPTINQPATIGTNAIINMRTKPPVVPTGVYENNDAHTVHIFVGTVDASGNPLSGGYLVTPKGYGSVAITSDRLIAPMLSRTDLNADGEVNIVDIAMAALNYGIHWYDPVDQPLNTQVPVSIHMVMTIVGANVAVVLLLHRRRRER